MVYGFRTFLLASSPDPAASDCGGGGALAETIERRAERDLNGAVMGWPRRVVRSLAWRWRRSVALSVSSCSAAVVRVVAWGVVGGRGAGWVVVLGQGSDVGGGAARSFRRLAAVRGRATAFSSLRSRAWCARPRASACGCAGGCHCRPLARRPSRAVALSPRLPAYFRHGIVWLLCVHGRHCNTVYTGAMDKI